MVGVEFVLIIKLLSSLLFFTSSFLFFSLFFSLLFFTSSLFFSSSFLLHSAPSFIRYNFFSVSMLTVGHSFLFSTLYREKIILFKLPRLKVLYPPGKSEFAFK